MTEPTVTMVAATETFLGDTGTLPAETRQALVQLLRGPAVDATRHSRLWDIVMRDQALLRVRLHELYLELIVDADHRVAYTRQVTTDSDDAPILLKRKALTLLESALLLYLRRELARADAEGGRAVVTLDDMTGHLQAFAGPGTTDPAGFRRQREGAVEKMKKLTILRVLRDSDDRFEVAPALKLLFGAEQIQRLIETYARLQQDTGPATPAPTDDEDE